MIAPAVPPDEDERLKALWGLQVLDSPPEEGFDRLTRLAQEMFDAPIALVSLIDEGRQWFKSSQGLGARETSREISFCGHAILEDDIFVVPDATLDPRFADNPLVTGNPDIRFYAGAPLNSADGHTVGTLCVIDTVAREWGPDQSRALRDLADIVRNELNQARIHNQQRALLALTAVTALSQEDQQSLLRQDIGAFAEQYGVSIVILERADGVLVDVDSLRLLQIMANLLSNAAKFSPAGSRIEVSVRRVGLTARVEVRDHGPGIPEEFRDRIFERFSQADGSDTRLLVERMGGSIGFQSEAGSGTEP